MKNGWRSAIGCVLAMALAGCGGGGGEEHAAASHPANNAAAPAVDWPQPVNGQMTEKMCDLLTNADYAKYGHELMPRDSAKRFADGRNGVDCLYMLGDSLDISVQPSAKGAALTYASDLREHKQRLSGDHRQTMLAEGVLPGADQSWFDFWTLSGNGEHELEARRGSLIVDLVLGSTKGAHEQDPKTVLTGLAGLIFQRVPNVGRTDTGSTHKARYQITGHGTLRQITYNDPVTLKTITLTHVKAPWHKDFELPSRGNTPTSMYLTGVPSTPMSPPLACRVTVDGKTIVSQPPGNAGANCSGYYKG